MFASPGAGAAAGLEPGLVVLLAFAVVVFGAEPAAVAAGALETCGFFAGAVAVVVPVPVPLSCAGFGATAVPNLNVGDIASNRMDPNTIAKLIPAAPSSESLTNARTTLVNARQRAVYEDGTLVAFVP